jgi:hypothetical protein
MFGMLDYRAYKLLWLICMPLRWLIWVAAWASIVIAIMFSASLDYSVPVRIAIAYAIWEGSGIVLTIIRAILFWFIKKGFFWLVDVVPAKADSVTEAKEMVVGGPLTWLSKKMMTNIQNWTEDDTEQLASLMNWRARLFFRSTERMREQIWRYQELYESTGKQPVDLNQKEARKLVADLEYSWFEKAIIYPISFNAILRIAIISVAIVFLDSRSQVGWKELGGFAFVAAWVFFGFLQIREERQKKCKKREEEEHRKQMEREEAEYRREQEARVERQLRREVIQRKVMDGLEKRLIGPR